MSDEAAFSAWNTRYSSQPDPITIAAFDALGAELEAQAESELQEMADLWAVWQELKSRRNATTQLRHDCVAIREEKGERDDVIWFDRFTNGDDFLHQAAERIRKQEAYGN